MFSIIYWGGGTSNGGKKGIWASSKATQGAMIPRLNEDPFYIDQEMGRDTLLSGLFALSTAYIKLIYKTPLFLSLHICLSCFFSIWATILLLSPLYFTLALHKFPSSNTNPTGNKFIRVNYCKAFLVMCTGSVQSVHNLTLWSWLMRMLGTIVSHTIAKLNYWSNDFWIQAVGWKGNKGKRDGGREWEK